MGKINLMEVLPYIDPAGLTYEEWASVGMALKHEGLSASVWDEWSKSDSRYRPGECFRKWASFQEDTGKIVTGGTVVHMAKERGWRPTQSDVSTALDWNSVISDELVVVDQTWIEGRELNEPTTWDPAQQIITYLETLFEANEAVGYVTDTWQKEDRYLPTKGNYTRTAGELIEKLSQCKGDVGSVLGDYNPKAGAWIRFNPLDGTGCKDKNVTDYRYALVESDQMDLERQNAIIRELELPVAILVHSGNKSLHAIVKVDAVSYDEYRKRVDYLYSICEKNGLAIDTQNKNPSRLSRLPGFQRGKKKQYIVDKDIGKKDWHEWHEWIESVNDDLPDPEALAEVWDDLPQLAPTLIDGVLRQGHKMLLAGPSKAGKSFLLIQLILAIAEGRDWLGWNCTKGRVLYVNLELDRASCLHRFKDVYSALGWRPENVDSIDIWNLRGKAVPMDKLAPKLIRRAQKKDYIAVVIDPIYKVITGDENSADQMAKFANQFDKICTELGTAVIYCHHHSKGYQGGKRSMDRASGSGVFARDPDALLDLTELDLSEKIVDQLEDEAKIQVSISFLKEFASNYYYRKVTETDFGSPSLMENHCRTQLSQEQIQQYKTALNHECKKIKTDTAWRIEGTLREFETFDPVDVWFSYPTHKIDRTGILESTMPEMEKAPWQKAIERRKSPEKKKEERQNEFEIAFNQLEMEWDDSPITTIDLAEQMGVTTKTIRSRVKEHGGYEIIFNGNSPGIVARKQSE
jgi:RecA-family ATPase